MYRSIYVYIIYTKSNLRAALRAASILSGPWPCLKSQLWFTSLLTVHNLMSAYGWSMNTLNEQEISHENCMLQRWPYQAEKLCSQWCWAKWAREEAERVSRRGMQALGRQWIFKVEASTLESRCTLLLCHWTAWRYCYLDLHRHSTREAMNFAAWAWPTTWPCNLSRARCLWLGIFAALQSRRAPKKGQGKLRRSSQQSQDEPNLNPRQPWESQDSQTTLPRNAHDKQKQPNWHYGEMMKGSTSKSHLLA